MSTKSVAYYEKLFDAEAKSVVEKYSGKFQLPITIDDIKKSSSPLSLIGQQQGAAANEVAILVLDIVSSLLARYGSHVIGALKGCCSSSSSRHNEIAADIAGKYKGFSLKNDLHINNNSQINPEKESEVNQCIKKLESGVLEQKCNPKGNYANLCRAIANKTHDIDGWNFCDKFKESLGIEDHQEAAAATPANA
jgi:hypothetical protein